MMKKLLLATAIMSLSNYALADNITSDVGYATDTYVIDSTCGVEIGGSDNTKKLGDIFSAKVISNVKAVNTTIVFSDLVSDTGLTNLVLKTRDDADIRTDSPIPSQPDVLYEFKMLTNDIGELKAGTHKIKVTVTAHCTIQ